MADKNTTTTTVISNPDGSIAVLEAVDKPPTSYAPQPLQPSMAVQTPFGGAGVYVAAPAPSRVIVACPRCGQHLVPPPGAPVYACTCGQQMRSPPQAAPLFVTPSVVVGGSGTAVYAGGTSYSFGLTAPLGFQQGAVLQPPPAGSKPGGAAPTTTIRTFSSPRVVQCAGCRTMLSTTADVTICGVCGFRNEPHHFAPPPPYPGARGPAVLQVGSTTIIQTPPGVSGVSVVTSSAGAGRPGGTVAVVGAGQPQPYSSPRPAQAPPQGAVAVAGNGTGAPGKGV